MGKGPKVPQSAVNNQVNLQSTESDLLNKYSNIALAAAEHGRELLAGYPQGWPSSAAGYCTLRADHQRASCADPEADSEHSTCWRREEPRAGTVTDSNGDEHRQPLPDIGSDCGVSSFRH